MNNKRPYKTVLPSALLLFPNALLLLVLLPQIRGGGDRLGSYLVLLVMFLILFYFTWRRYIHRRHNTEQDVVTAGDLAWKKLKRNRIAMFGMAVVVVLVYISVLAPFISPLDPLAMDWAAVSAGPGISHLLGTDELGRDILSRTIYGCRVAMGIGLLAVMLNTLLGTGLGIVAGYFGGWLDQVIMRILEFWNSIPFILMAIALMAALGTGMFNLILVVSLTGIMDFARIIRGDAMLLKETDYVAAAQTMGLPHLRILLRHILPNCISPIIIMATLRIGETILTVAGLSFLGLGIQAPTPSLGTMLSDGQQYLYENIMMSVVPGTTILLIVYAFNLFGDGLRDALDTKLAE